MTDNVKHLAALLAGKTSLEILQILVSKFADHLAFSTSFGQEDQVITDFIFSYQIPIRVFTLDTGRLFEETYQTMERTREFYHQNIEVYTPDQKLLANLLTEKGNFSFYRSVENRKECCHIRKIDPLTQALKGITCWITGMRAEQSENRQNMPTFEWDERFQVFKCHPLVHWTLEEVENYLTKNNVPQNVLHQRGFKSIGCAPCTRAICKDDPIRAGRWWWENHSSKECGLHANY